MSADRETLQRIGVWMEEGRTTLPDHVLDAVLHELPSKPQRRPRWPARRILDMSAFAKVAIAAAAVVAIVIVGFELFRSQGSDRVGHATPSPAPSVNSPTPVASPDGAAATASPSLAIKPGPYRWAIPSGTVSMVVPDGWAAAQDGIGKQSGGAEIVLSPHLPGTRSEVGRVFTDACVTDTASGPNSNSVAIGPTADDLIQALEDQTGTDAATSSFAGGTRASLREAVGLDRSLCSEGRDGWLKVWLDQSRDEYFPLPVGSHGDAFIFEEDGRRFVFSAQIGDGAREADVAELDAIVQTFEFTASQTSSVSPALAPPRRPGNGPSPAGVYGWDGGAGTIMGMHKVADGYQTSLIFKLGPECLAWSEGQQAEMVRVAGFDGVAIEPYLPPMPYAPTKADSTTRAHALAISDSALCAFVTWDVAAPDAMVAAALDVLDTLRAEPIGDGRFRVNFTLDQGWDVG